MLDQIGIDSSDARRFSAAERAGLYRAIFERRDIRSQFLSIPIEDQVLSRVLRAAHHAGSVGFMQPWNFLLIQSLETRQAVKQLFEDANAAAASVYEGETKETYRTLKLEGILEAPLNICITCDPTRGGPHVLGRHTIRETDVYSTCCAIQNLWLAARAEGIGIGWVSILDYAALKRLLGIPDPIVVVAYLCVGYVSEFPDVPELERAGWRRRLPLQEVVWFERWGDRAASLWKTLRDLIIQQDRSRPGMEIDP
jgi:5,6-dimethylbenzimidazole synthase